MEETIAGKCMKQGPGAFGVLFIYDGADERSIKGTLRCGNVCEECGRNPACIAADKRLNGD